MKVLVVGATGGTGCLVAHEALARGHAVTALVRDPARAADLAPAQLATGDVLDPASLGAAMAGQDAVACVLGTGVSLLKPVTLLSQGTRNLVDAMTRAGVRRLVCVTGIGAGDSRGHGGFLYDRIIRPVILRQVYRDKDRQEAIVRASGLDWVIVRPAQLTNGPARGTYRVRTDLDGVTATTISRADVAGFVVGQLDDDAHLGRTPLISD